MNEYVETLKRHVAENPPNYGSDAHSILEMLFSYYHECNNTDTDAVKAAFEDLYRCPFGRWIGSWMLSAPSAGNMKRRDLWKVSKSGYPPNIVRIGIS